VLLPALALVAAGACVAASFRRLWFAAAPTWLDLGELDRALAGAGAKAKLGAEERAARLGRAIAGAATSEDETRPEALGIERAIFADWIATPTPTSTPTPTPSSASTSTEARVFLLNEQRQELDWRAQRWARVPRVCASIAASSGLLLATLALRQGLGVSAELPLELQQAGLHAALLDALDVAAIGLAGTAFCIAIQRRARTIAKEQATAADRLVDRVERLDRGEKAPHPGLPRAERGDGG